MRRNRRPGPVNTNWGDKVGIYKLQTPMILSDKIMKCSAKGAALRNEPHRGLDYEI